MCICSNAGNSVQYIANFFLFFKTNCTIFSSKVERSNQNEVYLCNTQVDTILLLSMPHRILLTQGHRCLLNESLNLLSSTPWLKYSMYFIGWFISQMLFARFLLLVVVFIYLFLLLLSLIYSLKLWWFQYSLLLYLMLCLLYNVSSIYFFSFSHINNCCT